MQRSVFVREGPLRNAKPCGGILREGLADEVLPLRSTKGHEAMRRSVFVREGPLRNAKSCGGILREGPIGPRRNAKALRMRFYH